MNPNIEIYTGPMMSGKSRELVRSFERLGTKGLWVAAFQSAKNTRDVGMIASRGGAKIPATGIRSTRMIDGDDPYDAYIFDEFQFFEEPESEVAHVASLVQELGKTVIIGTLDYDYKGEKWRAYEALSAINDYDGIVCNFSQLTARCDESDCRGEASFTALLNNGIQMCKGDQVVIDGPDVKYSPRCSDHFEPIHKLK